MVVYVLYFFVKYLSFIFYSLNRHHSKYYGSLFCLLTCGCFCCCCCNCCNSVDNLLTKCNWKLDRWLLKLLLGRQEGVTERHHNDYQPDEDSEGKLFAPIYIRNKSLSSNEVGILTTLVLTFGLLIGITAFDVYFLDVSYACTDDKSFSCFVLPRYYDADRSELGITNQRINSCSPWENSNISDQVYVVCYKWVFNFKEVIIAVGGLLTLFQLTTKATTSILISLNACLRKNDCFTVTKTTLSFVRRALGIIVFFTEFIMLALVVSFTIAYLTGGDHNVVIRNITEHGNQLLLVYGIIATCVLLPIEDYIEDPTQQNSIVHENSENGRYQFNYGSSEESV